jgi:ABC-type nitrate/sulfonate/bicarbonate transport system permease component
VAAEQAAALSVRPVAGRALADRHISDHLLISVGTLVVFLALWEVATRLQWVNSLLLASPSAIAASAWNMFVVRGDIYRHLWVSAQELLLGFALAVIVGVPLGVLMGRNRLLRQALEPYIMALYSTPQVAFFPLLILLLGFTVQSKAALVFLGAVFPIVINTTAGVIGTDPRMIEMARSFTASDGAVFWKVILPAALPTISTGLRLAVGRALIMVFVAELVSSTEGLGYVIVRAGATFDTPRLFAGVLIFTLLGVLLGWGTQMLERRLLPWLRFRDDPAR